VTDDEARDHISRAIGSLPDEITGTVETGMKVKVAVEQTTAALLNQLSDALGTRDLTSVTSVGWEADSAVLRTIEIVWPGVTRRRQFFSPYH
jgi:hypothetical protein